MRRRMPAADPLYDLVLMLDSAAPDEQRQKVLTSVEQIIGPVGIVNTQDWGVRQTAYEIGHKTDAEYHLLQFHGVRAVLESLQRMLRITDGVIRYRIIKLKPGTPAPPTTRSEPRPTGIGEPVAAESVAVAAAPAEPADA
jgi:small subunit ribosomal protein S6